MSQAISPMVPDPPAGHGRLSPDEARALKAIEADRSILAHLDRGFLQGLRERGHLSHLHEALILAYAPRSEAVRQVPLVTLRHMVGPAARSATRAMRF